MRFLIIENLTHDHVANFAAATKKKHGLKDFSLRLGHQGHIELERIEVHHHERKQGKGSAAMKDLSHFADHHKKRVWLQTAHRNDGLGTTSKTRLTKFYRGHGYVPNKGRKKDFSLSMYASMYRNPK